MKIRFKGQNRGYSTSSSYLKYDEIYEVCLSEYQAESEPKDGWYLIEVPGAKNNSYNSDDEVKMGAIVREYIRPNLGDYALGPYQWIAKSDAEIIAETNQDAKHLLQKFEWRV
jgi:hypothetical protein